MKKDWGDYITDILNATEEVGEFTEEMVFETYGVRCAVKPDNLFDKRGYEVYNVL